MTSIILSSVALAVALTALGLAVLAYATVIGMQRSTHKVEWMPLPEPEEAPTRGERGVPKTLKEQIKEFAYPDVSEEQV